MSGCIDPRYEHMLHGFELGLLSEEDRQAFEEHLLDCGSCFEQAKASLPASILLRHDADVRSSAGVDSSTYSGGITQWFNLTRLVAVAAVLVAMALPAYWFGFRESSPSEHVQRLNFLRVRGGSPPVLYTEQGGIAELAFEADSIGPGLRYHVVVSSRDGEFILFDSMNFSELDSLGNGTISLPISDFTPGFYILTVTPRPEDSPIPKRLYNFRVR